MTNRKHSLLVTTEDPYSPASEALRGIRTSLKYSFLDQGKRVVLISSSVPGEGKTLLVANTGILMAHDGKKTLLIDMHLRQPNLHHIFNVPNRLGLGTILAGYCNESDAIINTSIPNLHLIPAGPIQPNPTELLGSLRLNQVIESCKKVFDIIILDTPAILSVSDALLAARVADGITLVVRSLYTKKDQIRKTQQKLEPFRQQVLGIVLNDKQE
jgi:protein-tyrosine kinase